jgi:hypothetical protein
MQTAICWYNPSPCARFFAAGLLRALSTRKLPRRPAQRCVYHSRAVSSPAARMRARPSPHGVLPRSGLYASLLVHACRSLFRPYRRSQYNSSLSSTPRQRHRPWAHRSCHQTTVVLAAAARSHSKRSASSRSSAHLERRPCARSCWRLAASSKAPVHVAQPAWRANLPMYMLLKLHPTTSSFRCRTRVRRGRKKLLARRSCVLGNLTTAQHLLVGAMSNLARVRLWPRPDMHVKLLPPSKSFGNAVQPHTVPVPAPQQKTFQTWLARAVSAASTRSYASVLK